jgi:hypothetical protein
MLSHAQSFFCLMVAPNFLKIDSRGGPHPAKFGGARWTILRQGCSFNRGHATWREGDSDWRREIRACCQKNRCILVLGNCPTLPFLFGKDLQLLLPRNLCSHKAPCGSSVFPGFDKVLFYSSNDTCTCISQTGTASFFMHATEALHGDLGGVKPGRCPFTFHVDSPSLNSS